MRRRYIWGAATTLAVSALLSACGGSNDQDAGEAAERIVLAMPSAYVVPDHAIFHVALGRGYIDEVMAKHNVQFEVKSFGAGPDVMAAYVGGSANWIVIGSVEAAKAVAAGQDLQGLFLNQTGAAVIAVAQKKYEQDRGHDLKKFAGGTFGYTREGGQAQTLLKAYATKEGLNWETDVKGIALGGAQGFVPAIQSGRVDVVGMDPISTAKLLKDDLAYVLFNSVEPKQYEPVFGKLLGSMTMTSRKFQEGNPELTRDFVQALERAHQFILENSDDAAKIYEAHPAQFKEAIAEGTFADAWPLLKDSFLEAGAPSDQYYEDTTNFWKNIGSVPGSFQIPDGFFSDEYVK